MTPIKRSGKSSGGVKGRPGTSNVKGAASKKSARKIKH
jgi:hypothetical protein